MAKDPEEDLLPEPDVKKKGALWKWVIIGVVVLVVVGGGAGGAWYYFAKVAGAKKPAEAQKPLIGATWAMDPFIVNLVDNEGTRYLKAVIQLEVSDPKVIQELDALKPKVRDSILDLLTSKTYKDMMDAGGKQRLREEIGLRVNTFLSTGKVEKVYFMDFVIQ